MMKNPWLRVQKRPKLNSSEKLTEDYLWGRGEFSAPSSIDFDRYIKELWIEFKVNMGEIRKKVKERIT